MPIDTRPTVGRAWFRYGATILLTAFIWCACLLLNPWPDEASVLLIFGTSTALAAWLGGLGPGLLATALSALAAVCFFVRPGLSTSGWVEVLLFLALGVSVCAMMQNLRKTRWHSDARAAELAASVGQLTESRDQYRSMIESVSDFGIYLIDAYGLVRTWNAGAERITGYREGDILGEHFSRFYTREDRVLGRPEQAMQVARDRGRFTDRGWWVRKDGSRFRAIMTLTPLHDGSGRVIGFVNVLAEPTGSRAGVSPSADAKPARPQPELETA